MLALSPNAAIIGAWVFRWQYLTDVWMFCTAAPLSWVTVPSGFTVSLNCSTSLDVYVEWKHNEDFLYVNGALDDTLQLKYSVNSSIRGQYDLLIKNVTAAEAGEYTCIDNAGHGPVIVKHIVNIAAGIVCCITCKITVYLFSLYLLL